MLDALLKQSTSFYNYCDDIEIYTEDIVEAFSVFDAHSSAIIVECVSFNANMDELMLEAIINNDPELMVFLNEGVIGATFGAIKKIIGTAFVFLRKLIGKINVFVDQYTASNTAWYGRYAAKVKAKANMARTFTYEGHKWNMDYMTGKPYPNIVPELIKQTDQINKAVNEYIKVLNSGADSKDLTSVEQNLQKAFPKGFRAEAKAGYEKMLKCKTEEISTYYYNLGSGGEKISIQAFRYVSIDTMLEHIRNSHLMIQEINDSMSEITEKINDIVDVIDKINIDDFEARVVKATTKSEVQNNSAVIMSVLNEAKVHVEETKDKIVVTQGKRNPKPWNAAGSIKDAADEGETDAENKQKSEGEDTPNEKEAKVGAAVDYTKTLRTVLNDSVSTWNLSMSIINRLAGVRTGLVKDANSEFIHVLTKFMSKKHVASGGDE
jgi:hypothetical protein